MTILSTTVGLLAALCTTASYLPQVVKCWRTHKGGDLWLKMLLILAAGLALWVVYGLMNSDWVIVGANTVSLMLLAYLVFFKVRELVASPPVGGSTSHRGKVSHPGRAS